MSILVLFSGGLDSTLLAQRAKNEGSLSLLLFARYGQPSAAQEAHSVYEWRKRNGSPRLLELDIPIDPRDRMSIGVGAPGPRVVPGRNLVLLAHAISIAATEGIDTVWYGANGDDHLDYDDCRPSFVDSVSKLAAPWCVHVEAPLLYMSKGDIMDQIKKVGVDVDTTWSCYQPRHGSPCMTCNSCMSRIKLGSQHD
jgi:7-cyano-7-deazaguanine synthase